MEGNIVGEPFEDFVANQIKKRQSNQFSGYGTSLRTNDQLQYLTNRNAWVKLASSVDVLVDTITGIRLEDFISSKLKNIGLSPTAYLGSKLAEEAILFNTLSSYTNPSSPLNSTRAGVSNTNTLWNNTFAYGLGGTDYGIQPPPGITGVTVDSLNRGSIRKAAVTLKAHNKFQFDVIELLYLRLGFTMMLEWGWDKYLDNDTGEIQQIGNTIIEEKWFISKNISQLEMLSYIQAKRSEYDGNYDGFFGKVSNFTWNFNPDGSYDISIDLITLGDVIESLKVNTTAKQKLEEYTPFQNTTETVSELERLFGPNTAKSSTLNTLGAFLFAKIYYLIDILKGQPIVDLRNGASISVDYMSLLPSIPKIGDPIYGTNRRFYYVRLGELLRVLQDHILPQIQNNSSISPQMYISYDEVSNKISYFPNQIPLDPRVCIFRINDGLNTYGDITGIANPPQLENVGSFSLNPYIQTSGGITCGSLMNLYMNIEFINELLISNGGPNQELSLFKFLQDLCNGINDALGGVNKLEPVIKDDSTIVIIDQTLSISVKDIVDLEVYGYNPKNQTSNFVKDLKFVSKITPQLASTISIGATAAGNTTSEIDGTAFSKWSEGLVDRFTNQIIEPTLPSITPPNTTTADRATKEAEFINFPNAVPSIITNFYVIIGITDPLSLKKRVSNPYYSDLWGKVMDFETFFLLSSQFEAEQKLKNRFKPGELLNLVSTNYGFYLVNAFGGTASNVVIVDIINYNPRDPFAAKRVESLATVDPAQSRYFEFNDTFITQGKAAYKNYINTLNNERFNATTIPSSEIGFIPLSFDLILDGISGIKIYNKLSINAEFLPSNYPDSLRFIITKVNHNISNNSWDTSLSTVSMPETKPYEYNPSTSGNTGNTGNTVSGSIGPQPDNGTPFLIVDNRNNQDIMTIDSLLSELDPIAHPAFRKFFNTLTQKYSGYKAGVNAVRRTWEESYNLKYTPGTPSYNSTNAEPGKSRHSYGLAIDINIYTPASTTKRTLLRDVKQPWIEEGINQVATDAGLAWGGNFNDVDAVHFEFVPNYVNTPYNEVLAQAKAIDPTLVPPFTPFSKGLAKCKKIDSLIKQGKIKLR